MVLWFEVIAVISVAFLGIILGKWFARLSTPFWSLGFILSISSIVALIIIRYIAEVSSMSLLCWIAMGRVKFVILALAITMGLTTLHCRMSNKIKKCIICIAMFVLVVWFTIFPFLVPVLIKDHLSRLNTKIDSTGVCLQTKSYT